MLLDPAAKKRICWFRIKLTNVSCIGAVWGGCGSLLPFTKQIKIKKIFQRCTIDDCHACFETQPVPWCQVWTMLRTPWTHTEGKGNEPELAITIQEWTTWLYAPPQFLRPWQHSEGELIFFTHSPVTWQWCQAYRKPHNHALLCFCTAMYSYMHPVFWKSNLGV